VSVRFVFVLAVALAGCRARRDPPALTAEGRYELALDERRAGHEAAFIANLARAADQGSPRALFALANAYRHGAGVPHDEARALVLYERAADLENPEALQALAIAHLYGELGLPRDESLFRLYSMEAAEALKHAH